MVYFVLVPNHAIVELGSEKIAVCDRILRSLPEWFGLPEAIDNYVRSIGQMSTWGVDVAGRIVGFIAVKTHGLFAAEVYVMGIERNCHRRGLGTHLIETIEGKMKLSGRRFLTVKTLSPSHPDPHYADTRAFYESLGFVPLEEFPSLWGEANPCLLYIKAL